jgi:hypothetical protein
MVYDNYMAHEKGEARHSAKLTELDVLDIRRLHGEGTALRELVKLYPQCSKPNLHHIIHGRRWRYLLPARLTTEGDD